MSNDSRISYTEDAGKLRCAVIQMGLNVSTDLEPAQIRDAMNEAHLPLIDQAGGLTAEDRQAEVEALRVRMFEAEHERRRISALDRAGDDDA